MKALTIFVDESGTLPDPDDKVVIIAAVGTVSPESIDEIIKQVRKKGKFKKKTGELKFYTSGNKTRLLFLEKIVRADFSVFALVIEKENQKISDTPEHFAMLCFLLLSDILTLNNNIESIIFDKHFSSVKDINTFNNFLLSRLENKVLLKHVDSKKDKRVNIADMVAGAILSYETGKNKEFYEVIVQKLVSLKRLNWKKAKGKFFEQ